MKPFSIVAAAVFFIFYAIPALAVPCGNQPGDYATAQDAEDHGYNRARTMADMVYSELTCGDSNRDRYEDLIARRFVQHRMRHDCDNHRIAFFRGEYEGLVDSAVHHDASTCEDCVAGRSLGKFAGAAFVALWASVADTSAVTESVVADVFARENVVPREVQVCIEAGACVEGLEAIMCDPRSSCSDVPTELIDTLKWAVCSAAPVSGAPF